MGSVIAWLIDLVSWWGDREKRTFALFVIFALFDIFVVEEGWWKK